MIPSTISLKNTDSIYDTNASVDKLTKKQYVPHETHEFIDNLTKRAIFHYKKTKTHRNIFCRGLGPDP